MKKRVLVLLTALLLSLFAFVAFASSGGVQDHALVLSGDVKNELASFVAALESSEQTHLRVITRHFLGGNDAEKVTREECLALGADSAVLLLVIGEENYVFHAEGRAQKLFPRQMTENLLAQSFRPLFKERRYDAAVSAFFADLAQNQLPRETFGKFFRQEARVKASEKPFVAPKLEFEDAPKLSSEENEFTTSELIVLAIILYFAFIRRNKRGGRGCGCGCAPFAALLAFFGLKNRK